MDSTGVLIVGAGPTGLVLALNLARRGVPFRIVDENAGPGEHSRAMVVQARTLEFYRQLGFAERMIDEGIILREVRLRETGRDGISRDVFSLRFGDLGAGISPYPFALTYPQDDHERFLVRRLAEAGGAVHWNTRLTSFSQSERGVDATVTGPSGRERIAAEYICGCDGAHSAVRETLGIGFPGNTYEQLFFVCDVKLASPFDCSAYGNLGANSLVIMFPVRSSGMERLIGLIPKEFPQDDSVTFEMIREPVERIVNSKVSEVNWFATYRVHRRVAERFHVGRAFILGDAAHIHSPAGGQGMNTGIGDATNLAWKLADAVRGRATKRILETFEEERIGFARRLVATTDQAFGVMVAAGALGSFVRSTLAPRLFEVATRFAGVRRALFRTISQTQIHYAGSTLSEGRAGRVRGGDRLPWIADPDNFGPLRSLDWQVHVYGDPGTEIAACCARLGLALHTFPWSGDAGRAGFARNATYLVRPDGYVALAAESGAAAALESFLQRIYSSRERP